MASQPTLRQEGTTEPVGDIILACSGPLIGAQTGVQTLSLYVNGPAITSRKLYTGATPSSIPTEAALLVNDCVTNNGTSASGANCAPSGTFQGGTPTQGFLQNGALVFSGFTLPTDGGISHLRVTNVRVNATQVPSGSTVTANVLGTLPVQNQSNLVVGAVRSSLGVSVSSPLSAVLQCQSQTISINNLTIRELINNRFKSPAGVALNSTPGEWYQAGVNSESQTVLTSQPLGWTNQTNAVPGQADTATRIRINLTNIPTGATVTMPVMISNALGASLVASASGDLGAFSPAAGVGIPITDTGSVTYEVRAQTANAVDSFTVPITLATSGNAATGTVLVSVTYAPNTSETTTQFPTFIDSSVSVPLVSVLSCQNPTQVKFGMQPGGGRQGLAIPAFAVQLLDSLGNITNSNAAVTVTPSAAALSVTTNAVNGIATFDTVAFGTPGSYTLTASSPGLTSATSPSFTINGPPSVSLTSSVNSGLLYGQAVTLTATVSPTAATGSVTFYDGTTVLGTAPVVSGLASLVTSLSNTGPRTLLAHYNGSLLYGASVSQPLSQVVNVVPEGGFAAAVTFEAGQSINAIGTADLNGDGVPDVIGTDSNGQLHILLGNSNGTLQSVVNIAAGLGPQGFATADFNGDGKTDVVVAGNNAVSVLLGKGDGTFQTAITVPVTSNPRAVAAGDFNGDGNVDLAVTYFNGSVLILLGSGDGTFQNVGTYPVGSLPEGVAVGDFNGDGKADLAVSNFNSNEVSVLLGNGDGTFQTAVPYAAGGTPRSIVVGDFNGDGKADLAVGNWGGGVSVLLGNGDGSFATQLVAAAGISVTGLVSGDFNGDGKPDLALTPNAGNTVNILLGAGNGTFPSILSYATGSFPSDIALADFNRDGKIDLVVSNGGASSVSVMLGTAPNPTQLKFTTQPASGVSGTALAPVVVQVQDPNGNLVFVSNASVTLTSNPGGASQVVNAVNGVATFSGLTFGTAGNYTFTASSPGVASAASTSFAIASTFPPSVVIDSTATGTTVFGPTFTVTGWAIDNINAPGTAIQSVVVLLDGVLLGTANYGFIRQDVCAAYPGRPGCPHVGFAFGGPMEPGTHVITVTVTDSDGVPDSASASVTITLSGGVGNLASRAGVFRNNASFLEDSNGNGVYDAGTDRFFPRFTGPAGFVAGDMPVTGDWTGDGKTKVGIYRSTTGQWFLDINNDGVFNAGDATYAFGGLAGDLPFVGDWTGFGKSCVRIYRPGGSVWLLDLNCNGSFDNTPTDAFFPFGGLPGDVPVVGNWFGGGTRVGVVRKYAPGGVPQGEPFLWVPDGGAANAGNLPANHPTAANPFAFGGLPGDVFVTGDWYLTGKSVAGVYRNGFWVLDAALPGAAQQYHLPGVAFGYGGVAGDIPVVGKW